MEKRMQLRPSSDLNLNLGLKLVKDLVINSSLQTETKSAILRGSPGNIGTVQGPARLIHSEADFDSFKQGEILVAPYTTPAWTPLLSLAAAVITEVGGSLSHAAIIAREYGVPAVVGIDDIMSRLNNGAVLEVDGGTGTVRIIENR